MPQPAERLFSPLQVTSTVICSHSDSLMNRTCPAWPVIGATPSVVRYLEVVAKASLGIKLTYDIGSSALSFS